MSIVGVELDTPEVSSEAESNFRPNMVVVGIGGGGGNAVSHMVKAHIDAVKTICINTDAQALNKTTADVKVQIGSKMTGGLGCGADPTKGKAAAEEDIDKRRLPVNWEFCPLRLLQNLSPMKVRNVHSMLRKVSRNWQNMQIR